MVERSFPPPQQVPEGKQVPRGSNAPVSFECARRRRENAMPADRGEAQLVLVLEGAQERRGARLRAHRKVGRHLYVREDPRTCEVL